MPPGVALDVSGVDARRRGKWLGRGVLRVNQAAVARARELIEAPSAWHHVEQYANNRIEADHAQLKRRLRPMRGIQKDRTAQIVIAGHAFLQIYAAATTNSESMPAPHCGSPRRSPNSQRRSDEGVGLAQRAC
jgi:hypothetical protein